ncbi:MAG: carbamate kinase [Actinomycetota bacterium]
MEPGALVVVALGGNAMQDPGGEDSVAADLARTAETAHHLVQLVLRGFRIVVTHGNGPQVGNHLLRAELGTRFGNLPFLPLDVCVADTQGGMGYVLQQCLGNALGEVDLPSVVVSVVTQILVERDDPAFSSPSKPVGEMIPADRVEALQAQGWSLVEDRHRNAWRRVVPSPYPKEIVEAEAIAAMVEQRIAVIAAGGGGIPVVQREDGTLTGVEAVVDKDLASALLAVDVRADGLVILTDVAHVKLGFDTPQERAIDSMTVAEARRYLEAGEFGTGSMAPKVDAVARFVARTGKTGIITSIDRAEAALDEGAGTVIVP